MDCKSVVRLPQNAALNSSDVMELRGAANIYLTTPKPGVTGRRFVSASDYVKYKKAASLAGSSPSATLPPQTTVITQLQNAGC